MRRIFLTFAFFLLLFALKTRLSCFKALARVIGVGSHFLGHGENRAHFGLGPSEAPIAELRVTWPDGRVEVLTDLAVDQQLTVTYRRGVPLRGSVGVDPVVPTPPTGPPKSL